MRAQRQALLDQGHELYEYRVIPFDRPSSATRWTWLTWT